MKVSCDREDTEKYTANELQIILENIPTNCYYWSKYATQFKHHWEQINDMTEIIETTPQITEFLSRFDEKKLYVDQRNCVKQISMQYDTKVPTRAPIQSLVNSSCQHVIPNGSNLRKYRSKTQNIRLLWEYAQINPLEKTYLVVGTNENIYTVHINDTPVCNCPDFKISPYLRCKHIYFILICIMKVTPTQEDMQKYDAKDLENIMKNTPYESHNWSIHAPKFKEYVKQVNDIHKLKIMMMHAPKIDNRWRVDK